jgi:hypothetical protein
MKKFSKYLLALSLLFFVACGNGDDSDTDKKDSDADKEEVKKDDDKTSSGETEKTDEESGLGENDLGLSEGLPEDFPDDVPLPLNGKCLGSIMTSEGTVVTFESSVKVKEIVEFYKKQMDDNGYELSEGGEVLVSDQGGLLGWEKGDKEVGIMLGYDKDEDITSVVITYSK